MGKAGEANRLIITTKGMEVSRDIKRDLQENPPGFVGASWDETPFLHPHINTNIPQGYLTQQQSKMTLNVLNKPIRSLFLTNTQQSIQMNNNNNISQTLGGLQGIILNNNSTNKDIGVSNIFQQSKPLSTNEPTLNNTLKLSGLRLSSYSKSKSNQGTSTFFAVSNKKHLQNQIPVESLGGVKLNLTNYSYANEINNQASLQKVQMQQVQQERLIRKYNDWNDQYLKSNELMKSKYYQKYEDIAKLGDKEDEDNFWKQWQQLKSSCEENLKSSERQDLRFEENMIRKLNKKYKSSFQTLPNCAKLPLKDPLPKIPHFHIKMQGNQGNEKNNNRYAQADQL